MEKSKIGEIPTCQICFFFFFFRETGVVEFSKYFWWLLVVFPLSTFFSFFIKIKIENALMRWIMP